MPLEIVSRDLQAVVHVEGDHLPRPSRRAGREQGGRIRTAAEADGQRQARRFERGHGAFEGFAHDGKGKAAQRLLSALVSLNRP
ncbi:hypothetical protein D9M69_698620 [compost metagenome]